jgi:Tfp pilus assembly protein PilO
MKALTRWMPRGGKAWGLVGGVVVTILAGVGIGLGPVRKRFEQQDETIVAREKEVARNLRILAPMSRDAITREYAEYGEMIKKRGSTAEENAAMISEIEKTATGIGLSLSATKPHEAQVKGDYERYEVEIEVDAEMAQIIRLIHAVESSAQILRVEKLTIDSKKNGSVVSLRAGMLISKVVTL